MLTFGCVLEILTYISPLVLLGIFYVHRKFSYWKEKGVDGPVPTFPTGNFAQRAAQDPIDAELDLFRKYGHLYGVYTGFSPCLTISDVDLVKQVLIKDFHLFVNRRNFAIQHKYYEKNLFGAQSEDWKRIRSIASPAFTSGKLRRMHPLLDEAIQKLNKYLADISMNEETKKIDIKNVIAGFTIDVIASTSFGIDTDTNGDRSKFNPFLHHGERLLQEISMLKGMAIVLLPRWVLRATGILHPFPNDSFDFFVKISQEIMRRQTDQEGLFKMLKEASINNEDLRNINYSSLSANADFETEESAKKENHASVKSLTEEELIAQTILFFMAGFETTASAITNTIFEFCHNPALQEKLYEEIRIKLPDVESENLDEYYDIIMNRMPYLEAVFKETLRKYPALARLERRLSAKSYFLGGVELEKDTVVEISTIAVHYDEKNYPNPMQYDPERFMPENKHLLNPYAYIPFGAGPRNCIGMRFAYQEAKICLASLVQKFRFEKTDRTPSRIQFPRNNSGLFPQGFEVSVSSRV